MNTRLTKTRKQIIQEKGEKYILSFRSSVSRLRELIKKDNFGSDYYERSGITVYLPYAPLSILQFIAKVINNKEIAECLEEIGKIESGLRDVLMTYDGKDRIFSLSSLISATEKTVAKSADIWINYEYAGLDWLVLAYQAIISNSYAPYYSGEKDLAVIMKAKYANKIFQTRQMKLARVNDWDDPYENYFLRHTLPNCKGPSFIQFAGFIYGMSWSTKLESDALWRIYSDKKENDGVQLRVKQENLIDTLIQSKIPILVFGRVTYDNEQKTLFEAFKNKCNNLLIKGNPPIFLLAIESLFLKRAAFSHEKEFRIITWSNPDCNNVETNDKRSFLNVNVGDPHCLFNKVLLDPRLINENDRIDSIKNMLHDCPPEIISVSNLYKFED